MGMFAGTPFDRPPHCERCDLPEVDCQCPPVVEAQNVTSPEKQRLRIAAEKRKKGKLVTVVRDLAHEPEVLAELLTKLKTVCGAGGTIKQGVLEIQGDHVARVRQTLQQLGYRCQ